jgi:hypothetical protein
MRRRAQSLPGSLTPAVLTRVDARQPDVMSRRGSYSTSTPQRFVVGDSPIRTVRLLLVEAHLTLRCSNLRAITARRERWRQTALASQKAAPMVLAREAVMDVEPNLEQLSAATICATPRHIGMRHDGAQKRDSANTCASIPLLQHVVRGVDKKRERVRCVRFCSAVHVARRIERAAEFGKVRRRGQCEPRACGVDDAQEPCRLIFGRRDIAGARQCVGYAHTRFLHSGR